MEKKQFVMKLALILAMVMFCRTDAFAVMKGDIDNSGEIDLKDAVKAIQVCAGMKPVGISLEADVNNDDNIGLADAVFALQFVAGKMKLWYKKSGNHLRFMLGICHDCRAGISGSESGRFVSHRSVRTDCPVVQRCGNLRGRIY